MSKKLSLVIAGSLYHSIEIDDFQYIKLALVGIDTEGRIAICREIPMEPGSDRKDLVERELQNLTDRGWTMDEVILPVSLIDPRLDFGFKGISVRYSWIHRYTYSCSSIRIYWNWI